MFIWAMWLSFSLFILLRHLCVQLLWILNLSCVLLLLNLCWLYSWSIVGIDISWWSLSVEFVYVLYPVWAWGGFAWLDVLQVVALYSQVLVDVFYHFQSLWSSLSSEYWPHLHFLLVLYLLCASLVIWLVYLLHQVIAVLFLVIIRAFE